MAVVLLCPHVCSHIPGVSAPIRTPVLLDEGRALRTLLFNLITSGQALSLHTVILAVKASIHEFDGGRT